MTNHPVASFTFRVSSLDGYSDQSFSIINLDGRMMIHAGDELLDFESFLRRRSPEVNCILRQFRRNPQMLDGSEIRLTHRLRHGRRIISIIGGRLHGRQF